MLDGVALEVNFCSFWKQALTSFTTAISKNLASGLRCHAGTEAVLTFADALGRLVSSFHGNDALKFFHRERNERVFPRGGTRRLLIRLTVSRQEEDGIKFSLSDSWAAE